MMDIKEMKEKACRLIEPEMERILNLPSLDNTSLNQLHMLSDTKKNFMKMESLENGYGMMNGNSYGGNSYSQGQSSNSNGYTYSMRGNSNGMVTDPYGYSRTDSGSHLEAAMRDASNAQEREEIRQIMAKYHHNY